MSDENVQFVRAMYEAAGGAGKEELLEMLPEMVRQFCDPEIEFVESPERVDSRVWRGHDGVLECWRRWLEEFRSYSVELEHIEAHGDDVFVAAREQGQGAASGAPAENVIFQVWTMRNGKLLRYREFYDESAARAALSEA
jgi:ketosteroid isomerase-like protein